MVQHVVHLQSVSQATLDLTRERAEQWMLFERTLELMKPRSALCLCSAMGACLPEVGFVRFGHGVAGFAHSRGRDRVG
jgi:hypothetical protein